MLARTRNGALNDGKVRRKSLRRTFERAEGLSATAKAVKPRQSAWSHGQSVLWGACSDAIEVVAQRLPCRIFGLR